MKEQFKENFNGITSLKKMPVNLLGGLGAMYFPNLFLKTEISQASLFICFVLGFIYMNFLVKELNIITLNKFKYFIPIILILLSIIFILS